MLAMLKNIIPGDRAYPNADRARVGLEGLLGEGGGAGCKGNERSVVNAWRWAW